MHFVMSAWRIFTAGQSYWQRFPLCLLSLCRCSFVWWCCQVLVSSVVAWYFSIPTRWQHACGAHYCVRRRTDARKAIVQRGGWTN